MKERVTFADKYLNDKRDIDLIDKAWSEHLKTKQDAAVPDPRV